MFYAGKQPKSIQFYYIIYVYISLKIKIDESSNYFNKIDHPS